MSLEATDGGRKPRATDDDILDAFRETDDPVLSTAEVADVLPIKRRGTLNRLRRLQENGRLDSKQIGGRNTVWWLVDEPTSPAPSGAAGAETAVTSDESDAGAEAVVDTPETVDVDSADEGALSRAEMMIREIDLPGSGSDYENRVKAVLTMYEHLRSRPGERLSKSDFEAAVEGRDVGYGAGFTSLWSNWVKANEEQGRPNVLVELPGVELRGDDYVFTEA